MPRDKTVPPEDAAETGFSAGMASTGVQAGTLIEKKQQQIVDGACRIFFEKGFHPTTTRDIAKACGMSIGQLYHYITSKDDVLFLVHKHSQKIWHDYLKKVDRPPAADPLQRLRDSLYYSLEFIVENRKLIQFMYSESKYLDKLKLKEVLELDRDNVLGFWRELLAQVREQCPVKVDIDFGSSLIAFLMAFMALRGWTLPEKPNREHADQLVAFILRGIGLPDRAP